MKIIIYILLFLLIISIVNNYVLHYYKTEKCPKIYNNDLLSPSNLPKNIGIASLYVFYNKNDKYNKCLAKNKNIKKSNDSTPFVVGNLNEIIDNIYKKTDNKCYIVYNDDNKTKNLNSYLDKAIEKIG